MGGRSQRNSVSFRHRRLAEEGEILKAILLGETLPITLNKLCTLIDFQIGDVVSLVCLASVEESFANSIAQTARKFGLNVFSFTNILSPDRRVLGTFQVYSCERRRPTPRELQLIERVTHLAGIALQHHRDRLEIELFSRSLGNPDGGSEPKTPPFVN